MEISACDDSLSKMKVTKWENEALVMTNQHVCELAVPGACPRIRCKNEKGDYAPCRMLAFVESQENESGFWMRLPCSSCTDLKQLHPVTEGFVHG